MGSGEKGDWEFQDVVLVRTERKGQGKAREKRNLGRHRVGTLEKTQGKRTGEKTQRRVKDIEVEGRERRGIERRKGGEVGEVWENRGEGKEVGNVIGASGWQGWMGWGRAGG